MEYTFVYRTDSELQLTAVTSSKILIFEYFDMENTCRHFDEKIQITHAEHYSESDNLFLNQSF